MGSMCSKRPEVIDGKRRTTKVSKVTDLRKKYEYICMLGNGGFGKVRLYRDKFCKDMKYAIKTIKKEYLGEHLRETILEEVKILRELDHPNIVKYYETYEDEHYIHIVMEYLHGEDLFKVITMKSYNQYNEVDAAEIISYLLKALGSIHNKAIVHRDLKPENILFSVPGDYQTLKLIDFGLSAHVVAKNRKSVGTPFYMAPEIIDGNYSYKTDIWSVGVILYVLMTGRFPFYGATHDDVFEKIINEDYDENELNESRCSDEVKDLISKLLVKNERHRLSLEQTLEHPWFKKMETRNEIIYKETTAPSVVQKIYESIKKFTNDSLFKKEVLFYIAKISKDEEISKLKDAFMLLDKDNTGTLTFDEILNAFEKVGLKAEKVIILKTHFILKKLNL
jgi:calcium-dependent protein kinase